MIRSRWVLFLTVPILACGCAGPGTPRPDLEDSLASGHSARVGGLPVGWNPLSRSHDNTCFGAHVPEPNLLVRGDFDGDGIADLAQLLTRPDRGGLGLFVWLSGNPEPIVIYEASDDFSIENMGVELVAPGNYDTVCGLGYYDCADGETSRVELRNPSINLFQCEGASTYLWWNDTQRQFTRASIHE